MAIVADSFGQLQNFRFQLPQIEQRQYLSALEQRRLEEEARNRRAAAMFEAQMQNRDRMQRSADLFGQSRAADIGDMRTERFRSILAGREQALREREIAGIAGRAERGFGLQEQGLGLQERQIRAAEELAKANQAYASRQEQLNLIGQIMSAAEQVDDPALLPRMFPGAPEALLAAGVNRAAQINQERQARALASEGAATSVNRRVQLDRLIGQLYSDLGQGTMKPSIAPGAEAVLTAEAETLRRLGLPPAGTVNPFGFWAGPRQQNPEEYLTAVAPRFRELRSRIQEDADRVARSRDLSGMYTTDETGAAIPIYPLRNPAASVRGAPPTISTTEQYNALPVGTVFIDANDGKRYRKGS